MRSRKLKKKTKSNVMVCDVETASSTLLQQEQSVGGFLLREY